MFTKRVTLFRLLGFAVRIDASWLVLAVLVTWSLAHGAFPYYFEGLVPSVYWSMGVAGALGLFGSILLHELAHSIVARRYGIRIKGITLFIFGGVAEMEDHPPSARSEFLMAIAGPIASLLLGLVLFALWLAVESASWPLPVSGVVGYLALINTVLAVFNMVPAFPLDGGRVLRALLWAWKDNVRWATQIASRIGSGFGAMLMALGVVAFIFSGNLLQGVWWFMIGIFVRVASQGSYQQLLVRRALEGEPVRRFMHPHPIVVPRSVSIREFVEQYVYTHHYKMFPVRMDAERYGCVTTRDVKDVPQEDWDRQTVGTIAGLCSDTNSIGPDEDAMTALTLMNQTGNSRLLVMEREQLVGVIALKDLLRFLSLKLDLEGGGP